MEEGVKNQSKKGKKKHTHTHTTVSETYTQLIVLLCFIVRFVMTSMLMMFDGESVALSGGGLSFHWVMVGLIG